MSDKEKITDATPKAEKPERHVDELNVDELDRVTGGVGTYADPPADPV